MHLKNLEIHGFKSFADKITMDFGSGITGIVGPNGSGKSNISDAIRWVMGEQSAKSLRGGNMQDVIFSGTQKRRPVGFAEVSLTIDNTDKKLGIDYDEVTITRRVFRSGESEYFINKASSRLKDIHELFMDTGVGREGYSIIGQGKIAEIIGSKSEDRRQIFEEAAGITKFRYRKEEAERKLAHTHENVLRVSDIITELEIQVEPLMQQSEKAKKFLNFREELKILEVNVSLENISRFKKALEEVADVFSDVEKQVNDIKEAIEKIENDTKVMFDGVREKDEMTELKREQHQKSSETLASYQSDISVLNNKIEHNNQSIDRIEKEINELNDKLEELDDALLEKDDDFVILKQNEADLNSKIDELNKQVTELNGGAKQENEKTEEINTELVEKLNQIAEIRSKISNYGALIDNFSSREKSIEKELDDKKDNFDSLKQNVEDITKQLDEKTSVIKNYEQEIESKNIEYNEKLSAFISLQKNRQQTANELEKTISRQKILQDMEKSFDNYSRSVKSVMQAHQGGELKSLALYGTLAQLMEVSNEYAVAIEVALGAAAQNIVTETENDAKRAIEYLKRTKQGRATFLPISASRGSTLDEKGLEANKGYIGIASDLVSFEANIKGIVTGILGRVAVVDNIDNAIIMARKYNYKFRIVTLDGELLAPGGSMSGGSRHNSAGLFARANELVELGDNAKRLQIQLSELENDENNSQKKINEKQAYLDEIRLTLRQTEADSIKLTSELKHSKTFLDSIEDARNSLIIEKEQLGGQIISMQSDIKRHNDNIETKRAEIASLEKQAEMHKSGVESIMQQREAISLSLIELKMQQSGINKDIEMHNERIEMVKTRRREIEQNINQKRENIQEVADTNEDLQDDIEFKIQQINDFYEEVETLKIEISALQDERRKTQEMIKSNQDELKVKREQQFTMQQEQGRIESKKAKAEVELENTINRLWEEYELTITTAEEYNKDIGGVAKAQKRINELKEEIRELGNINIDAIEEYKNIKERFEFLSTQRDDLVDAQKNLEAVIANMVEIMKEQFSEKFKIINHHFNEVFVELFGGGKAQLKLTEPNDILASGVDIDVQPPGKAVKNMLQLSGGEQAFVSIALLFAILKVRPSPFCILDEIEAALDDVNVYRFADYLKKFCGNSQFIVVTHRRGTMEAANILYGVTMQEQGVTKLLSLNIDDVIGVK